jgi:hypothetical protein
VRMSRASSRADWRTKVLSLIPFSSRQFQFPAAHFPDQWTKRRSISRNSRLSP